MKTDLKRNEDFFHNVDFIQLSNFLFKPYSEKNDLTAFLQQKDKSEDKNITLADLEPYRPKSNWDRYFKDKVDVEGEHLKKLWENLYDIRCAIAHCREISQDDFKQLQQMSQEVSEKLNNALDTINTMDNEQRQELAQNLNKGMAESVNDTIPKFLGSDYNNILASIKENLQELEEMLSRNVFSSQLYISLNQAMAFAESLALYVSDFSDAYLAAHLESLVGSIRNHMAHVNYDDALKLIKQAISEIDEKLSYTCMDLEDI